MTLEDNSRVIEEDAEMAPEYDFSKAVQGKHFRAYQQGYTVTVQKEDGSREIREYTPQRGAVVLDADVAKIFPDSDAVNAALRFLIRAARQGNPLLREQSDEPYDHSSEVSDP